MIHGRVRASKPKTIQDAIEISTKLMNKKISTLAECQTENKKRLDNTSKKNQNQQQQTNKRQNTGWVYTAASGKRKESPAATNNHRNLSKQKEIGEYIKNHSEPTTTTPLEQEAEHRPTLHRIIWWKEAIWGSKPLCAKCNYHHDGLCAPKCHNCNNIGHFARDCRVTTNTNNANNQRGTELGQKPTCYECGVKGHYKRECPKLKNDNNQGNQGGRNNAPARVYAVGRARADPDANV
nr:hypothetical protein [Tanacetum cinerariifolium]